MKWALASIGLLTLIVVFSLAALDQKNVVWTDGVPTCPHCRSVVNEYSNLCATCGQAFDWETWEGPCSACLSELDAGWLRRRTEGREAEVGAALIEAGIAEEAVPDFLEYLGRVERGDCGFCGGTGRWLAPGVMESKTTNGDANPLTVYLSERLEKRCPVCLGSGRCRLCDGDHLVVHARESAARELSETVARLAGIDLLRDRESMDAAWSAIRGFAERNAGRAEIAELPSFDEPGDTWMKRATDRLNLLKKVVSELR